jgi:hypothetical membrane protein
MLPHIESGAREGQRRLPSRFDDRAAGVLLLLAGSTILMGIITAEALYPAPYNTRQNTVSDLGAMRPDNIVRQPSASLFNGTMIAAGAMIAVAALLLALSAYHRKRVTIPIAVLGLGMIGVGFFPGTHMAAHTLFAMTCFTAGGVGAVLCGLDCRGPLRGVCVTLGSIALIFLVIGTTLMSWPPVHALGDGGVERWIVYPVVLWLIVFGTSLLPSTVRATELRRTTGKPVP